MEKQVMSEFVRILKISKIVSVPLQLLQTVSILVQNLRNEHAICRLIDYFVKFHVWKYLTLFSFSIEMRYDNKVDGLIMWFDESLLQITCLVTNI